MTYDSVKLTKRWVDSASPCEVRYTIWDAELRGFGVRIAPSGTKTYIVRYRPRGLGGGAAKRFVVLGRHGVITADDARNRARVLLGEVAAGKDPAKEKADRIVSLKIAELVDLFIEEHLNPKRKARTASGYAAVLKSFLVPKFGRRPVEEISPAEIAQLHLSLRDRPYQANRLVAMIASMYSFAARRGVVKRGLKPTEGIVRFKEEARERFLGTDELARLGETLRLAETVGLTWEADDERPANKHSRKPENRRTFFAPEVALAFRLLLLTGARLREILRLEWSQVDLERKLIFLPDSKTGRKTLVISDAAAELLSAANRKDRFVIPGAIPNSPRSDLKKPWQAIQRHANLEGVRIHDLRHTFASVGAGSSLGLPIVGKLLGHTQPATTARYAHLDVDPLRRATNIIGAHLAKTLSPASSDDNESR